jgi:hypothetical protein
MASFVICGGIFAMPVSVSLDGQGEERFIHMAGTPGNRRANKNPHFSARVLAG